MDWVPPLGVTSALGAYAGVAIAMVAVEVYLLLQILPREGGPPTLSRMTIGSSALLGSAAFLLSLLDLLFFPNSYTAATVVLWGLNFMMFAPPGLWVIAIIVYHDRRVRSDSLWWPVLIAGTATSAEIMMGLLFSVSTPIPVLDLANLALALVSPWFAWSMAAAMAALLLWVPLPRVEREGLATLVVASIVVPWVAAAPLLGALLMSATMAGTYVLVFRRLSRPTGVSRRDSAVLLAVSGAFIVMAGAVWLYLLSPGTTGLLAFGTATMLVMATELAYVARRALSQTGAPGGGTGTIAAEAAPVPAWDDVRPPVPLPAALGADAPVGPTGPSDPLPLPKQ